MNLLSWSFELQGYPVKRARQLLEQIFQETERNLEGYQERKKWEIFYHHLNNNPAYRNFAGKEIKKWEDIPVLRKRDIQLPLEERLSRGYSKKNAHVHNTSGSTGTPFFFAKDKFCHALSWAVIFNRFGDWHKVELGRHLQARFYGIPLSKWKYRKEKLKDRIAARVRFPVFNLSDEVLSGYLEKFKKHPFVYLNGYTSSLVIFARYLVWQKVVLKDVCPTLRLAFTTSEVCDDIDRSIMEQGFGIKVVNEYGAAELDLIGFEDTNGNWRINHETLLVEVLDDNDKPVQPGEEGRIIITALYNKAMPFIRYELGDRVILEDYKVENYQILKKVVGRINDVAILPGGKVVPGLTFYYISKALLEQGGFMKEFIIRQTAMNCFLFEYVAERPISKDEEAQVKEAMNLYLEPGLTALFEKKEFIQKTQAGKLKHFFCEIPR